MKFIALGENASSFYDASTGLYIGDKHIVPVNEKYLTTKKVRRAINGGHLTLKTPDDYTNQEVHNQEEEPKLDFTGGSSSKGAPKKSLLELFGEMVSNGASEKKLQDSFNKEALTTIAASYDLEVEAEDTKATLVTAILEAMKEEKQ